MPLTGFFILQLMKEIQLTQGKVALVDDEMYEYLNQFKWYANNMHGKFYAVRNHRENKGKQIKIPMHRLIIKPDKYMVIDHLDGNSLNNQKNNLRICNHIQNSMNRIIYINNKSGFKGVYWNKPSAKWMAYISFGNKMLYLGLFINPKDAARAYNNAAIKYHGEFANLNKID